MPRTARIVAEGLPHHITQRGNYQQSIFFDDSDREQYLRLLDKYSKKFGFYILAYCLMPNHVHIIGIPATTESLSKTFQQTHQLYSQYMNIKKTTKGHLWQGRFYSCILDDKHLIMATKYVERNPVKGGLVTEPWTWKWSSASVHINNKHNHIILLSDIFSLINMTHDQWRQFISYAEANEEINQIRSHTLTGRPLGSGEFIKKLEIKYKRRLVALPRGRPFKEK
jgi:putative transposase